MLAVFAFEKKNIYIFKKAPLYSTFPGITTFVVHITLWVVNTIITIVT